MSKWDKLNKRLDDALDGMSESDWIEWDNQRSQKRTQRKNEYLIEASKQERKISIRNYSEEERYQIQIRIHPDYHINLSTDIYVYGPDCISGFFYEIAA